MILRCSIIYGPQSPVPVARPLFLQFIAQQLAEQKPTTFFYDEFRSPVFVMDIVHILVKLLAMSEAPIGRWGPSCHVFVYMKLPCLCEHANAMGWKMMKLCSQGFRGACCDCRIYNVGGPHRLSRLDMARQVAEVWGLSSEVIVPAPCSSVQRPVRSPADISMDSSRLEEELGVQMTSFREALRQMHESDSCNRGAKDVNSERT